MDVNWSREELREELLVLLATSRELSPDTDAHLAGAFLERLDRVVRDHGLPTRRPGLRASGRTRMFLITLAVITSILPLTLIFGHDSHAPQWVYAALWLLSIPAALAAVGTMAAVVVGRQVQRALMTEMKSEGPDMAPIRSIPRDPWQ